MGSILHISCPTSQKLYFLHWIVEIVQLSTIGVPLIYAWKHMLKHILD